MTTESEAISANKSTSAQPDLDWSQVKETVLMLKLAATQVEYSLRDGNSSVDTLTTSFTTMAETLGNIEQASKALWEKHNIEDEQTGQIIEQCENVADKTQQAIIAFQFYDKLVQRLDHVVKSLTQLGDLVGDPSRLYSPFEWRALQDAIRSKYSMQQERELFDALMNGEDIETVLERLHEMPENISTDDDIELF